MKTIQIFGAALLGLVIGFSAHAQTPVVGAPGTMTTPGSPATPATNTGTIVPGQLGTTMTGTVPTGAVTPIGTPGAVYPSSVPARNVDGSTLRTDQPVGGNPATTGSQPTRTLNRNRTTTTNSSTTRP